MIFVSCIYSADALCSLTVFILQSDIAAWVQQVRVSACWVNKTTEDVTVLQDQSKNALWVLIEIYTPNLLKIKQILQISSSS